MRAAGESSADRASFFGRSKLMCCGRQRGGILLLSESEKLSPNQRCGLFSPSPSVLQYLPFS
jgi:hypothetical protein